VSRTHVPADLRRLVAVRAEQLCEYCRIHEDDTFFGCEVDHIISEKHRGLTVADNAFRDELAIKRTLDEKVIRQCAVAVANPSR
jgi:hypothetical protein